MQFDDTPIVVRKPPLTKSTHLLEVRDLLLRSVMTRSILAPLVMLVVAVVGCGPTDDCKAPPFANPSIVGGLQGTASAPFVVVQWDASVGDLPDSYFEAARVSPIDVATGISYVSPRQLKIQLVALAQLPVNQTIEVSVDLPDTRNVTSCHHPGMADVYAFDVELQFDSSHTLTRADVTPIQQFPGAI